MAAYRVDNHVAHFYLGVTFTSQPVTAGTAMTFVEPVKMEDGGRLINTRLASGTSSFVSSSGYFSNLSTKLQKTE